MRIKSQSSFEMLLTVMVGIALITPMLLYIMTVQYQYADSYKVSAAQNAVNKIAEAADTIFLQGSPAKMTITINFPEEIREVKVEENIILIKVSTTSGETTVYQRTKEPLSGTLPVSSGLHKITVENKGNIISIH